MLKQLSIAALAALALPSLAAAQQPMPSQPMPPRAMPSQSMPMQDQGVPMYNSAPSQAMAPSDSGGSMRDEYGNRYNGRGDRIDRSGRIIPPPVTPPGARAYR